VFHLIPAPRAHKVERLLIVRHATPCRNLLSIFRTGLRPDRARGKMKVVWLDTPSRTRWAVAHVARRHRTQPDDVAVLSLKLPRSALRRTRRGTWVCFAVIDPRSIFGVNGLQVVA
jgi:hypothetical protein